MWYVEIFLKLRLFNCVVKSGGLFKLFASHFLLGLSFELKKDKKTKIGEETGYRFVVVHISYGIPVNYTENGGHYNEHYYCQLVDKKCPIKNKLINRHPI